MSEHIPNGMKFDKVKLSGIKPLYMQIYDHIDSLIETNVLKPGDQLLSEKLLESKYNVSKITIRRAIQELVYEEKVVKIVGKGTFVLQPKIEPLPSLTSFSENMRAQGYIPSHEKMEISLGLPNSKIRGYLKSGPVRKILIINRLMLADGLPIAIQCSYLADGIYQQDPKYFTRDILTKFSLYKILKEKLSISLYRADEWVDASKATREEADQLHIEEGDSVLVVERVVYSTENNPIEYVKMVFRADKYRYKVELYRPQYIN